MIFCAKDNPHRFCNSLADAAAANKCKLARRPFNRFKPELTSWWLVPSNALPFYQFKKIYIDWNDKKRDSMLCGLYFEKGLAPELATVYPSRKGRSLLMKGKWHWHEFLKNCNNGSFAQTIQDAVTTSGLKIEFHISGGYVDDPALFDPYGEKQKKDHYIFDLNKDMNTLNYRSAKRDTMTLKCLNKVKNINDLCNTFQELNNEHFLWLDIFIASKFQIPQADTPETDITSSIEIWNNFLKIFFAP
jgi:hypothetical protein